MYIIGGELVASARSSGATKSFGVGPVQPPCPVAAGVHGQALIERCLDCPLDKCIYDSKCVVYTDRGGIDA